MKMFTSIMDFLNCYENPGESCSAKLYKDSIDLIKYVSQVLEMYKHIPGVMP